MNHLLHIERPPLLCIGHLPNHKQFLFLHHLQGLVYEHCPETGHSRYSTWEPSHEELQGQIPLECHLQLTGIKLQRNGGRRR